MRNSALITLGLILFAANAWGGTWSSGGGNAVVCSDSSGRITSAETLDLYEGRVVRGLTYPASTAPYMDQAVEAAKSISEKPGIPVLIAEMVPKIAGKMKFLPSGTGLQPINDSMHIVMPKGCQIVQTARYELDNTIYVDADVWAAMNEQSRAALLMHETLYWVLRLYGEQTSQRTRAAVAHAFARTPFPDVNADVPAQVEVCQTELGDNGLPWATFYSYPTADKSGVIVQFVTFGGTIMLSKTTANLFGAQWPLSTSGQSSLWYVALDSIIDTNVPFLIRVQADKDRAGFIDYQNGMKPPQRPFRCSVVQQ